MIGTFERYQLITKAQTPIPIIKDEKDGTEYLVFGIIKKYNEDLLKDLLEMESIEQYNYLLYIDGKGDYQIEEKYGIKFSTFNFKPI